MKPRAALPHLALPLLLLAGLPACGGCSCGEAPAGGFPPAEVVVARDLAASHFRADWLGRAREVLAPLVQRKDAAVEDLVRAADVELAANDYEAARPLLERAAAADPDRADVQYNLYRLAKADGDFESALEHVRRAHELAPDDFPTHLHYASALMEADRPQEAERELRILLERGVEFGGSWLATTNYRLSRLMLQTGRRDEAQEFQEAFNRLQAAGFSAPASPILEKGTFGIVQPHRQVGWEADAPGAPPAVRPAAELPFPAGAHGLVAVHPRLTQEDPQQGGYVRPFPDEVAATLLVPGADGLRAGGTAGAARPVLGGDVSGVVPIDFGDFSLDGEGFPLREGDGDLVALVGRSAVVLRPDADGWKPWGEPLTEALAAEPAGCALDYDHDGDLDLALAGAERLLLFRNDGAGAPGGGFTEVGAETPGIPRGVFRPLAEDLDGDQDVDLVLVAAGGGVRWISNERAGRFEDATASLPAGLSDATSIAVADFDGDGRPDVLELAPGAELFRRTPSYGWRDPVALGTVSPRAVACDWDGDLTFDLVWPDADGGVGGILAVGFDVRRPFGGAPRGSSAALAADLDGDLDLDLAFVVDGKVSWNETQGEGTGLFLSLQGRKDNARGVGAVVEVRDGVRYRRIFWRGEPEVIGLAGASAPDVLRVLWPNGVTNQESLCGEPDDPHPCLTAPGAWNLIQRPGHVGSCPFLYTWNGETYTFVSDVLGGTPLGLPMAPGELVPPDHDEYVLVRGDQLAPRDGSYDLQFTEELREVTYLDRIRLHVIDHPADVEVFPNERFTFPPFPEPHVHTVRDALVPQRAVGSDGRDWSARLAANDRDYAVPFRPYGGQFLGLATPHWIELSFDPERVAGARKLRLLMNGWLSWSNASVNVAAARHPAVAFVPPLLQVPDEAAEGGWRTVGPPLGFPAGKLKTMVVDVTELLRDTPRFRVFSTLELYWDSIRLAVDDDDAPFVDTAVEPASAELWSRGFTEAVLQGGDAGLEWFEWERVAAEPRWNQHPGLYTRYGDCVELLGAIDDRFAILGAGDALRVRFPAAAAPPLRAGWRRDFLVFLDGWAKDRDPNSIDVLEVEPLPFHAMSGYPYGPDERFPDDELHRRWRAEWNTRPARTWIEPLSPRWDGASGLAAARRALAASFRPDGAPEAATGRPIGDAAGDGAGGSR